MNVNVTNLYARNEIIRKLHNKAGAATRAVACLRRDFLVRRRIPADLTRQKDNLRRCAISVGDKDTEYVIRCSP